jgi:hypothetical protein
VIAQNESKEATMIEKAIAIAGEWCVLSWAWWRLGSFERTVLALLCGPKAVKQIMAAEDDEASKRHWASIAEAWTDVAIHAGDGEQRDLEEIALSRAVHARSQSGAEVQ